MNQNNNIESNLEKYGWHFIYVFDPKGEKVSFSYSIGFEKSFNHPEIMIFGLEKDTAHSILSDIFTDLKSGKNFKTDIKLKNVIGGDHEVVFKKIKTTEFSKYLGTACDYYKKPFNAWIMFWPDKNGVLPFEKDCEVTIQNEALNIAVLA